MSTLTMAMNRRLPYSFFRECMKRLPKMETIVEEVYVTEKEPGPERHDRRNRVDTYTAGITLGSMDRHRIHRHRV